MKVLDKIHVTSSSYMNNIAYWEIDELEELLIILGVKPSKLQTLNGAEENRIKQIPISDFRLLALYASGQSIDDVECILMNNQKTILSWLYNEDINNHFRKDVKTLLQNRVQDTITLNRAILSFRLNFTKDLDMVKWKTLNINYLKAICNVYEIVLPSKIHKADIIKLIEKALKVFRK